jgi:predicted dehydrogenase
MRRVTNKKIQLALIGAGGIGHIWARAINGTKGVTLSAVADIDLKKAQDIARTVPGCRAVKEWRTLLKDKDIDAFIVAAPHRLLAPISYAALSAGKHVLCEKPSGINAREVGKNTVIAKKKGLIYMPGFIHRFHPAFIKAKEVFDTGGIGKVVFIRARHGFGGRPGYGKEWRLKKKVSGGGELLDQGIHMIDISRWFMGDFKDIEGFAQNFFWGGDVEDNGFLLMRTKYGQVAQIHVSWTNWDWIHSFEIFGDKGYLQIDGLDQRYHGPERLVWGRRDKTFAHPLEKKFVFGKEQKHDSFRRELTDFANGIRSRAARKKLPQGSDAEAALTIVEKIYKHGKTKK